MSDETEPSAVTRPASCQADLKAAFPTCDRCGLAWDPRFAAPACAPMTPRRLRAVLESAIWRQEASHAACLEMNRDDPRVDPMPSLKAAAELRAVLRFVDRVLSNDQVLAILKPKKLADHG